MTVDNDETANLIAVPVSDGMAKLAQELSDADTTQTMSREDMIGLLVVLGGIRAWELRLKSGLNPGGPTLGELIKQEVRAEFMKDDVADMLASMHNVDTRATSIVIGRSMANALHQMGQREGAGIDELISGIISVATIAIHKEYGPEVWKETNLQTLLHRYFTENSDHPTVVACADVSQERFNKLSNRTIN